MDSALIEFVEYLRNHGVVFELSSRLHRCEDHDGPLVTGSAGRGLFELPGHAPVIEYRDPAAGLAADDATQGVALALLRDRCVHAGERFWDVGCGTGVLAVVGARLGGTGIVASDISDTALSLARRTLDDNGVKATLVLGPLLDGMPEEARADVMVANLPHKPGPEGSELNISQDGGVEGDEVHGEFVPQALRHLAPGGRVLFFLHSLPSPRLLRRYQENFGLRLLSWRRRFLQPGEYGALQDHFVERARRSVSYLGRTREGRRYLVAGVWEATPR